MKPSSSSSPSIRFIAIAASVSSEFGTMSSRPTYRGVRNQWPRPRGYSSRPAVGGDGGGGDRFVSGDSHYQTVREANQGFRPRGRSNYGGFRPNYNRTPPPPTRTNYAPAAFNQSQQFRPPTQQFRPRPQKPMDYRNWEFVKSVPPPQYERFTVLSYNILADYLAINHRGKLYSHIPWRMLDWEWRTRSILFELGLWSADILCFQEVDRFQDLEEQLKVQGYSGIWKMRTGVAVDGCAIFWRASRFKLIYEEGVEFNKLGLRDNVAQICVLESLNQSSSNHNNTSEKPKSSPGVNRVVICNIHVLYNPKRGEIKLGQVRVLLSRAHAVSRLWDVAPVVLCGDFNCTPKSPLYNYISEQKLDLSDLPRDQISGQASAQRYPTGQGHRSFRGEGASSTAAPSVGVSNREVNSMNSVLDFKDNNSSQINAGSDVSDTSGIMQEGNKLEKETHQAVDRSKDEARQDPVNGLDFSPRSSQDTDLSSVAKIEYEQESAVQDSGPEDISCSLIKQVFTEETPEAEGCRKEISTSNSASVGSLNTQDECVSSVSERNNLLEPITLDPFPTDACSDLTEKLNVVKLQDSPDLQLDSPSEHPQPNLQSEPKDGDGVAEEGDIFPSMSDSNASISLDSVIDKKLENLSLIEFPEINVEDETSGEESSMFLSELHGAKSSFSSEVSVTVRPDFVGSFKSMEEPAGPSMSQEDDVPVNNSEYVNEMRFAYDPSAWTPGEICTATGDADCKYLDHPLKLRSTYTEIEDSPGTRDSNGEPQVTSYNRCFIGTVDYIWRSEGLETVKVLAPIPKHAMMWTPGYPTKKWGSDHIALVCELAFTKDVRRQDTDVS